MLTEIRNFPPSSSARVSMNVLIRVGCSGPPCATPLSILLLVLPPLFVVAICKVCNSWGKILFICPGRFRQHLARRISRRTLPSAYFKPRAPIRVQLSSIAYIVCNIIRVLFLDLFSTLPAVGTAGRNGAGGTLQLRDENV